VIRFSIKSLAGRKLRTTLTALAIVLGVAMMSGTFVLTDTIDRAFSNIFDQSYAGTDVVVSGKGADISFQGISAEAPPIPADLLAKIRELPSVELATGSVSDETNTKIIGEDGKAINTQGAPSLGFGVDASPDLQRFNPLNLLEGRWPRAADEVVLDAGVVDRENFAVGDEIEISTLQPKQEFTLVGVAKFGDVNSLGSATFAIFDVATAQRLFDRQNRFDAISVAGRDGTDAQRLIEEIQPVLPEGAQVRSAEAEAEEDKDEISEFTSFIQYFLLAFAMIALFVGSFVIFNTLSITVAQRTREFATVRTLGASRRQVLGSVLLEAVVIGLLASLVGLFGGLGLAKALEALFRALDLELPLADTVFATRTIVVSLLVGTLITLVAGLFPAIRATRVPPIAAVREGFTLPRGALSRFVPAIAVAAIAVALFALGYSMFADDLGTAERLLSIAAGVLLLFVGVAMISSKLVRPLAVGVSPIGQWLTVLVMILVWPFWTLPYWLLRYGAFGSAPAWKRIGAFVLGALLNGILLVIVLVMWARSAATPWEPEWPMEFPGVLPSRRINRIGRENSRRNPGRTAATAAALMIGVALVAFVATLANGMKASNRGAIEDQVIADYVVTAQDGFTPFVAAAGDSIAEADAAEVVSNVRAEVAELEGDGGYLTGIEPETIAETYRFDWKDGSNELLATLGRDDALLDEAFAEDHGLAVGDTVRVLTGSGEELTARVRGIFKAPPFYPLLGGVTITKDRFDDLYDRPRNQFTFVNVAGEPDDENLAGLEAAAAEFPDAKVQSREAWIDQQDQDFNQFLTMLYVLLALSVIISLFGMVNTLVLSVFERTRELGMLRAVGMTRRQTRRMIRHESVITALIGAALGLPLGIFLAALVTQALGEFDVRFQVPVDQLIVLAVLAIVVGIVAAIAPARRAARLNPLEALQYE
jgi:putative ABC transport system permease protein